MRKLFCFLLLSCALFGLEETFGPNPTHYIYPYFTAGLRAPKIDIGAGIGIRLRKHLHGADVSSTWNYAPCFHNYINVKAHYICYLQPSKINSFYLGLGGGLNVYNSYQTSNELFPEVLIGREIETKRNKHSFAELQTIYLPDQNKPQFALFYGWGF